MIDVVATLLLIAADPEPPVVRVIRVAPSLEETTRAQQQAEAEAAKTPRPEPSTFRETRVAPLPEEPVKVQQQAETAASNEPYPKIADPMMGLSHDDYPAESLRANEEGTVRIAIEVDAGGKATRCTVIQPSEHPRLNEKTCQVAMERASFSAARDKEGKAIASVWRSPPVRWKIPQIDHEHLLLTESYVATTIQIGADGTLGECKVETSGNMVIPNACEQTKARMAKNAKEAARWWKSVTDVLILSHKDVPPDISKPEWGTRQSRLVSAQLLVSGVMSPVACETILTEGWAFGGSACPPPDKLALAPPNTDWSKARTSYTELASFGQPR